MFYRMAMFLVFIEAIFFPRLPHGTLIYQPVGCYLDNGFSPHPMPLLLKDFRPDMNWNDIAAVIERCAALAHDKRFSYFGLKYYGECWSGQTVDQTYSRDGLSNSCVRGVGLRSSYFVYKFYDYGDKIPGCKEKWKAQSDYCFQVITNDSLTNEKMSGHCRENGGKPVYATDKRSVHLVEQLLSLMQLNSETNSSRCVVIGDKNASSFSTLPRSSKPALSSATHACAVRETDKWKIQSCNATNCYHLCITPRENIPVKGRLVQFAADTVITGHVIRRLLVDDVIQCARECLLYLNCLSINYEYKSTASRRLPNLGMICELNDEKKSDVHFQSRDGYKYYEKININSLQ